MANYKILNTQTSKKKTAMIRIMIVIPNQNIMKIKRVYNKEVKHK